jgi:hypothetical protein
MDFQQFAINVHQDIEFKMAHALTAMINLKIA